MLAHPSKARPAQVAGSGNEAHNALARRAGLLKHLPQRPAPKIHIQVVQIFDVDGRRQIDKVAQDGSFWHLVFSAQVGGVAVANPFTPSVTRRVFALLTEIRRVAH